MTTGTVIAQDALACIGAHSTAAPASDETILTVVKLLNNMLEMWLSKGIQIGFTPLDVPSDELNETADSFDAIIFNLAIKAAPFFDNGKPIVSADLRLLSGSSFRDVKAQYQRINIPKTVLSSTTPRGQGNVNDFFRQPFVGQNAEID